jgi:hypothetical protein
VREKNPAIIVWVSSFFSYSSLFFFSTYTVLKKIKILQVIDNIKHVISITVFDLIVVCVKKRELNLWKSEKLIQFLIHMVTLTIYKDFYNKKYKKPLKKVELGYKSSYKSLNYNS